MILALKIYNNLIIDHYGASHFQRVYFKYQVSITKWVLVVHVFLVV